MRKGGKGARRKGCKVGPKKKQKKTLIADPFQQKKRERVIKRSPQGSESPLQSNQYVAALYQRRLFQDCRRVTKRWETRDLDEIRGFQDRATNGEIVYHYANLSDTEIWQQRAYHLLPGTEKIFSDSEDIRCYTFTSSRGLGMLCELIRGKKSEFGVLYFGIGDDRKIFHRYFKSDIQR